MRKTIYLAAAVITACALFFTALALTRTARESVPITRMIDTTAGQIRVEVAKDIYRLGEPIQMRIFQKNIWDYPIGRGLSELGYGILDSSGQHIFSTGRWYIMLEGQTLSTMEEIELRPLTWHQNNMEREQVPPAIYTVQVFIGSAIDIVEFQVVITE